MAQGVDRLKELLFETETKRIDEVRRQLEAMADSGSLRHSELAKRVDAVFDRAGTEDRLQKSVAGIIDGALRDAEVSKHEQLSRAVAPLVIKTIKYELKNSEAEMVDALYPITGKLVKQYVQAAISDLMVDINRRLGGGGRMSEFEARAKAQGVTVAELVLAETQQLKVDELFLIRRSSGELVGHWERPLEGAGPAIAAKQIGSNRDVLIAGYLSGITAFSEEAFTENQSVLRALDLNGERIFVRASAAYLLAARVSGSAPAAIEQVIDDEFLRVLAEYRQILSRPATAVAANGHADASDAAIAKLMPALAVSLEARLEAQRRQLAERAAEAQRAAAKPAGFGRLYVMAAMILLPLLAWLGWSTFEGWSTARTLAAAQRAVAETTSLAGYPVRLDVDSGGRALTMTGLVPSQTARDDLVNRMRRDVARAEVRDRLAVLPAEARDVTLDLALLRRAPLVRAMERTENRLGPLQADMTRLAAGLASGPDRAVLERAAGELATAAARAQSLRRGAGAADTTAADLQALLPQANDLRNRLAATEVQVRTLAGIAPRSDVAASPPGAQPGTQDVVVVAEDAALACERLAVLLFAFERTLPMRPLEQQVTTLKGRVDAIRIPDAIQMSDRDRLWNWTRANAVFFANGTDLRDDQVSGQVLDALAQLVKRADAVVRVVGYTDERGAATLNAGLALARAERVVAMLVDRGVPRDRLVSVGRTAGAELSRDIGPGSANRRVEFELGFIGEPGSR